LAWDSEYWVEVDTQEGDSQLAVGLEAEDNTEAEDTADAAAVGVEVEDTAGAAAELLVLPVVLHMENREGGEQPHPG
jgi:hypothetical protein